MSFSVNESNVDRILRVVAALILFGLAFFVFEGWVVWVLGIVGIVLLLTGAVGFCPMYTLLGFGTKSEE
jgi:membrane-bound ClpP family serine protease